MLDKVKLVTLNGREYRIDRLDAIRQLHVARRLAPLVANDSILDLARAMAEMSQENADYVIGTCLDVVQFKQVINNHETWHPLRGRGVLMAELDGKELLELVVKVAQEHFQNFFEGLVGLLSPDPTNQEQSTS